MPKGFDDGTTTFTSIVRTRFTALAGCVVSKEILRHIIKQMQSFTYEMREYEELGS